MVSGKARSPMDSAAEVDERFAKLHRAAEQALSAHQLRVFLAVVVQRIPFDVLAEQLGSDRNAIYKTLYDARQRLTWCWPNPLLLGHYGGQFKPPAEAS